MNWINTVVNCFRDLFPKHIKDKKGFGISIIIPFRQSDRFPRQEENFKWVKKYLRCHLPWAEIIVGHDHQHHRAFSKSSAVNNGVSRSDGDILVILDADGYISIDAIRKCARRIRKTRERGYRLWYVPYRQFYRLTDGASRRVLKSEPCDPYTFPTPPDSWDIQNSSGSGHGHWFGALVQILPREAFDICGGWDERFRGWGGEDHSAMRMTDTLFWNHKTLPGQVLHLWHPMLGKKKGMRHWIEWSDRLWDNQETPGDNSNLATRYSRANGDIAKMKALVKEWK